MKVNLEVLNKEIRFDCLPKHSHFVYGCTLYFKTGTCNDGAGNKNAYNIHQSELTFFPSNTMVRPVTELTAKY